MDTPPPFSAYDLSHCVVLLLTVVVPWGLIRLTRADPTGRTARIIRGLLSALLIGNLAALLVIGWQEGENTWTDYLPMHLCDWLCFIVIAALGTKRRGLFELAYFWGLAGTLQGVLTPDLRFGFPHPYFFTFHIGHSGILTAVAFLTWGCGLRPRPGSILRAWLWLQVYLVTAAGTNLLFGTNFGYLCQKPQNPSLLDFMGPWPWYVVALELLALLFFSLAYLPWLWIDSRKRHLLRES
jgi:hypothetical integral membrane protein (TIGR02206 family)